MRLFDTSAWIEKLIGSPLGLRLDKELPDREDCLVPTIVQLELAKWLAREATEEMADVVIAYTMKCMVVPLDTALALSAAHFCRELKLPTADAIVYATACQHGADLVTCDAHFQGLPGVAYFARQA
jgi:predicted nucleic acid-binding protein